MSHETRPRGQILCKRETGCHKVRPRGHLSTIYFPVVQLLANSIKNRYDALVLFYVVEGEL